MKKILFLLSTIALSSCDSLLEEPQPKFEGTSFNRILARQYKILADKQELRRDWKDAGHFQEKANKSALGIGVLPEHPEDWDVRAEMRPVLLQSREKLMKVADARAIRLEPELSAQSYSSYDCWVEQEGNWWLGEETTCRTRFFDTIDQLSISPVIAREAMNDQDHLNKLMAADKVKKGGAETSGTLSPEEAIRKRIILDKSGKMTDTADGYVHYVLYFNPSFSALDKEAEGVLKNIASEYKEKRFEEVNVNGHTDKKGTEDANLNISQKRSEEVAARLRKFGIPGDRIMALGFGESDPQNDTADGVAERLNRRVEVQMK
jgi:outer membrane protein OmpA-like peptidoglycan-associated protein